MLSSINNLNEQIEKYTVRKNELLAIADRTGNNELKEALAGLSLSLPNAVWKSVSVGVVAVSDEDLIEQVIKMGRVAKKYVAKKEELLLLAKENGETELIEAIESLSFEKSNVIWDDLETLNLPDEFVIRDIIDMHRHFQSEKSGI
jgi:hypothetical protein